MKYSELRKETVELAKKWQKYSKLNYWKNIFQKKSKEAKKEWEKIQNKKEEALQYYQDKKSETEGFLKEKKKKIENILPNEEQLKVKKEALLYRTFLGLEKMPVSWVKKSGKFTGNFVYRFHRRRRSIALKQLKMAFPSWNKEKIAQVAEESFENLGETIFETLKKADYGKNIEKWVKNENISVLEKVKNSGAILVSGHFANWELVTFSLEMAKVEGIFLVKEFDNLTKKIAERWRNTSSPWEFVNIESSNLPFKIAKTLKKKKIIYIMLDTDSSAKSLECTFFGKKTNVVSSSARIAKKYQIPVISCFNYRSKQGKHIFRYDLLSSPPYQESELELTQKYTVEIEKHIRKYPNQWRWAVARWKTEL